ncbi:matrix metalloproteinase-19-like [Halyomorpha halys]|uniref:matrix metalloproteinase-19-like n=1 Tax=Halyomorpha halys TaxID=286706 RepID=UPI0034D286F1
MYLSRIGYLKQAARNPSFGQLQPQETSTETIKEFQSYSGTNVRGELDDEMQRTQSLPRCGVEDKGFRTETRSKRYANRGNFWTTKDLTYRIFKYPSRLYRNLTELALKKAFNLWSDVTPLTFTQMSSGPVNIEISFVWGYHHDATPFDGPGNILAHATSPFRGVSYVHFDDTENWTFNSYSGFNLFQVAAHEFGHALGLVHSYSLSDVMASHYNGYRPDFKLHGGDIYAIQRIYGKRSEFQTFIPSRRPFKPSKRPRKEIKKGGKNGKSIMAFKMAIRGCVPRVREDWLVLLT